MYKDSIALIGFMATGKTAVGKALVEFLGNDFNFIETDEIIIKMAGKSIPKIFSEDGEQKFRAYEIEACKKASKFKKIIISCGGGVVLNEKNIKTLKNNCHMILLTASSEEIYMRVMSNGKESRPIINKEYPLREIERILKNREYLYNSSAEIIINTTGKSIDEIVREIVEKTNIVQKN